MNIDVVSPSNGIDEVDSNKQTDRTTEDANCTEDLVECDSVEINRFSLTILLIFLFGQLIMC